MNTSCLDTFTMGSFFPFYILFIFIIFSFKSYLVLLIFQSLTWTDLPQFNCSECALSFLKLFILNYSFCFSLSLLPLWLSSLYLIFYCNFHLKSESKSHSVMSDFCNPVDYTVHGILQARILEWVAYPFSSRSSQPRNPIRVSCIAGGFFTNWVFRKAGTFFFF